MNRQAYECEKMDHICKTVTRSDGTMKIYSINTQGKLLTVVMVKDSRGNWTITEIAVEGKITGMFPVK